MIDGISKQFFLFTQESIEVSLYQEGSKCYAVTSLDDGSENDDAVTLWEAEAEENSERKQENVDFVAARDAEQVQLFLDDHSESQYRSLLNALHSNQVVQKVSLFRKRQTDSVRVRTPEELQGLYCVLQRLSLRELSLSNFCTKDLPTLAKAMPNLKSLENIQLHLEFGTIDETMAKALASLPNLISLELEVKDSFSVAPILQSESLHVLGIISNNFEFKASHIMEIVQELERNKVLTVLDIEPKIEPFCLQYLMHGLRFNNTLETLQFSCESDTVEGDPAVLEILSRLVENSSLRVLWNHCYESLVVSDKTQKATLRVLKHNSTIEQFHVFFEDPNFMKKKNELLE